MCGILGMIGSVPSEHARTAHTILQNIFIFNKSRGEHASGFSAIHNTHKKLITEKRAISSLKLVERSSKFKALRKDMPNIFIGHTRLSTSGTPKRGRNNHPFNSNKYSMVHNGGITGWQNLVKANNIKMRSETDSEVILRLAERKDTFHEGISHAMGIIGGTSRVAVAFLRHADEPRLFLFRNYSQPIHIMTYPRLRTIFFSSEGFHLKLALKSIFGDESDKFTKQHEISITSLPEWSAHEFMLAEDGRPILREELDVKRSYHYKAKTNLSSQKTSLPVVSGPHGQTRFLPSSPVSDLSTTELLKRVSPKTKTKALNLVSSVRDAGRILNSIRKNPYMGVDEIDHWKKWSKVV